MSDPASPSQRPSSPSPPAEGGEGEPIDTRALRRTLGRFATGVCVVTCRDSDGRPVGVTANSFSSVSLEPPLVLWSIAREAHSFHAFCGARHFAFSVLALDQVGLSNRFARQGADKFSGVATHEGLGGVPLIAGSAAHVECVQHATFPGGDHTVILGEVRRFAHSDRPALVFADGRYSATAAHPGTDRPAETPDPSERDAMDDFLLPLLFRAYTHVYRAFADTLEAEASSGAQMRVLSVLSQGPQSDAQLLTRTFLSQSRCDEACEALERQGFIAARGGEALITDEGRAKLSDLLRAAAERERHSTRGLDPAETALLRTLIRKLVRHHEEDAPGAAADDTDASGEAA